MFGYVKPHNAELLVKEYELYRAMYCGVCKSMQKYTGRLSAMGLSYDVVFLSLVRAVLTDEHIDTRRECCVLHPLKKRNVVCEAPSLNYSARVCVLLAYWKLKDDSSDENLLVKIKNLIPLAVMRRASKKARLPELNSKIKEHMKALSRKEKAKEPSLDACADIFGTLLGDVFSYEIGGELNSTAYEIGKHLGRFIYIADALDDYDRDTKKGAYNPLSLLYGKDGLSEENRGDVVLSLRLEISALAEKINLLPYERHVSEENIIKNTVYYGLEKAIPCERCINEKSV